MRVKKENTIGGRCTGQSRVRGHYARLNWNLHYDGPLGHARETRTHRWDRRKITMHRNRRVYRRVTNNKAVENASRRPSNRWKIDDRTWTKNDKMKLKRFEGAFAWIFFLVSNYPWIIQQLIEPSPTEEGRKERVRRTSSLFFIIHFTLLVSVFDVLSRTISVIPAAGVNN